MGLERFFEVCSKEEAIYIARALMFLGERERPSKKSELSDIMDAYFMNRIETVESRIEIHTEILLELLWMLAERMKDETDKAS